MFLELPNIKTFLILAPHPDDESLSCSGTALLLTEKGVSATVVFITNGERLYGAPSETIAKKRTIEANRAANLMGCSKNMFLNIPDGEIDRNFGMTCQKISNILNEVKPEMVFSPSPLDYHQDHTATARVSLELHREFKSFKLSFYEVYSSIRFTHLINISRVIERKKELILNYHTSLYEKPEIYVDAILGLNAHKAIFTQKKGYFEAFFILDNPIGDSELFDLLTYKRA